MNLLVVTMIGFFLAVTSSAFNIQFMNEPLSLSMWGGVLIILSFGLRTIKARASARSAESLPRHSALETQPLASSIGSH